MFGLGKKEDEVAVQNQEAAASVPDTSVTSDVETNEPDPDTGKMIEENPTMDASAIVPDASGCSPAQSEEYDINQADRPKHAFDHLEEEFVEWMKEFAGEIEDIERKAKHLLMRLASRVSNG